MGESDEAAAEKIIEASRSLQKMLRSYLAAESAVVAAEDDAALVTRTAEYLAASDRIQRALSAALKAGKDG